MIRIVLRRFKAELISKACIATRLGCGMNSEVIGGVAFNPGGIAAPK
jgi:hypothetical protein